MNPSSAPAPSPSNQTADVAPQLSLAELPLLQALVLGAGGASILRELEQLTSRESQRARRFGRSLFARVEGRPGEPPEVAVVCDISETGVRLRVSPAAQLDLMQARNVWVEVRRPGAAFVRCDARLVRVAGYGSHGVELAFAFSQEAQRQPALHEMLRQLAKEDVERRG